jgi:hypothetical protein
MRGVCSSPRRLSVLVGLAWVVSGSAHPLHADVLTFEPPTYSGGAIVAANGASVLTNRAFTGLDGWSDSSSSQPGGITTTLSSGRYVGGQAIRSGAALTSTGGSYIGVKNNFQLYSSRSYTFDMSPSNSEVDVGGWSDTDGDGLYDQTEVTGMAGFMGTTRGFGFRSATFSSTYYSSGVQPTLTGADAGAHWYRVFVTAEELGGGVGRYTMGVYDLTDDVIIDLAPSDDNSVTFTTPNLLPANFGAPLTDVAGVVVRVSSNTAYPVGGRVDNIQSGIVPVPEPATGMLLLLAGPLLLRRSLTGHRQCVAAPAVQVRDGTAKTT